MGIESVKKGVINNTSKKNAKPSQLANTECATKAPKSVQQICSGKVLPVRS